MKYLVYGVGQIFNTCKNYIDGDIVGYVDSNKVGHIMSDGQVVSDKSVIYTTSYDFIIIASDRYRNEIYKFLTIELGVIDEKIKYIEDFINAEKFVANNKTKTSSYLASNSHRVKDYSYKRIFIVCPGKIQSGGPELLHQLAYHLSAMGFDARMAYVTDESDVSKLTPQDYKKYLNGNYTIFTEDLDKTGTLIIVPETMVEVIGKIKKARIYFWWLSVDNYLKKHNEKYFKWLMQKTDMHLYQSEYARIFLKELGVPEDKRKELSDYINDDYFCERCVKEDIIAYNPEKGRYFTSRIINALADFTFVPIQNMRRNQVIDLLKKSKVYIDFGNHPGKDRIPREAALLDCCVITGQRGAANNSVDVAIPLEYKVDEYDQDALLNVSRIIKDCITNYDNRILDFNEYKGNTKDEKRVFIEQIQGVFEGER